MKIVTQMKNFLLSGQAGIVLTSYEPEEALKDFQALMESSREKGAPIEFLCWDPVDGLTDTHGNKIVPAKDVDPDVAALGMDDNHETVMPLSATLKFFLDGIRGRVARAKSGTSIPEDEVMQCLLIRNFDRYLYPHGAQGPIEPGLLAFTQKIVHEGQACTMFLVMQTAPEFELPSELTAICEYVHHELPTTEERAVLISDLLDEGAEVPVPVLNATAGLSRSKTSQYCAETLTTHRHLNASNIFQKKANYLAKSSKLDVWSPEFVTQLKLWPTPEAEELRNVIDVTQVAEETHLSNSNLNENEIRIRVRYVDNGKNVERWLEKLPKDKYEAIYRPERDFYTLKSVVGLEGLKRFLRNGFRPGVPDRAKMKHVLMLGVPGTGKSFTMQCTSGEFRVPLSSMQASNLYSKWLGDTDKILSKMLQTVEEIGGILAIDEFQRFLPQGGPGGESGGVENRMLGTLLTWFNNQNSNLVLSAANNISNLPDEVTRSGRVDAIMFVGFPGRDSKDAAWEMYRKRHMLPEQELPQDNYWTPADIASCCRLSELQQVSLVEAAKWVTPSYDKNKEQMDNLMDWAEKSGCICAETGEPFKHPRHQVRVAAPVSTKVTRKVRKSENDA